MIKIASQKPLNQAVLPEITVRRDEITQISGVSLVISSRLTVISGKIYSQFFLSLVDSNHQKHL
jgi:hypothetical protein